MMEDDEYEENRAYYEDGFSSYHSDAIDPSPWLLIGTVAFCLTLVLLLPLCVALNQRRQKKKRQAPKQEETGTVTVGTNESLSPEDSAEKAQMKPTKRTSQAATEPSPIATTTKDVQVPLEPPVPTKTLLRMHSMGSHADENAATSDNVQPGCFDCAACGADNPFFILEGDEDEEDEGSVYGLGTEPNALRLLEVDATTTSPLSETMHSSRRSKGGRSLRRVKGLANFVKRAVTQPTVVFGKFSRRRKAEEKTHAKATHKKTTADDDDDYYSRSISTSFSTRFVFLGEPGRIEEFQPTEEGDLLDDDRSGEDQRSLLSELIDEFDLLNGPDGDDDDTVQHSETWYIDMTAMEVDDKKKTSLPSDDNNNKYKINLGCGGKRPWYRYYFSKRFIRKVWKCASWDDEMKKIVRLAIPYTLHAIVTNVFELMELAVIGQVFARKDATILGCYLAIDFVLSLSTMLLDGALSSLIVLCSHAVGANNYPLAGKYCQVAILFHQAIFLPIMAICWNRINDIVLWLGFEEEAALNAEAYGRFAFVTVAVEAYEHCFHHMLDVCGFEWYSSVLDMVHGAACFAGVFAVGMFYPDAQLWMAGAVHISMEVLFLVLGVGITVYKNWLPSFWSGLFSISWEDTKAIRTFFKIAAPLSVGYMVEYCEWEVLFVFAACQGPAEVAVWGMLGYIWELGEHVSEAFGDASEVRVAKLLGAHCPALARYSSHKSLLLGAMTAVVISGVIFLLRDSLPAWLTTDETLQDMLADLLPLLCVGLAALTFGSTSWTIICAQGRTKLATTVTLLGSILVTLPLAVVSTFVLNWNLQGLLASIVIGYALSGIVNSFIMVTSKWERISSRVAEHNAKERKEMNALKKEVKRKAKREVKSALSPAVEVEMTEVDHFALMTDKLNTTLETESDKSTDESEGYEDYDWDELPSSVRAAAKTLGYTKRKWDFDVPIKADDLDWDELTPRQQTAAQVLKYTQEKWDAD